jgi:peptidoglycan/LPS O-acetylase OafA/YrhL
VTNPTTTPNFIAHLHAFRGFAILTIVAAHSWSLLLFSGDFMTMSGRNVVFAVAETLLHGSTIYFALISGLLFSLVLRRKGWKAFFKSKALNVLVPYALVSLFFLSVFWPMYVQYFESQGMTTNFPVVFLNGLLKGTIMLPFWYIPVLMILYFLTPIVDVLLNNRRLFWLALVLLLLPLVVSRTTAPNFQSVQTVVYFLGAYTAGMLAGTHYRLVLGQIEKHLLPIWVAALGCSAVALLLFLNEYVPGGPYSLVQTLVYVQKLSIAALVLYYFSRHEESLPKILSTLGTYAFAIYFLHFFMVNAVARGVLVLTEGHVNAYTAAAGGLLILVGGTALSLFFSWLLKRLFRSKSRMVIGA